MEIKIKKLPRSQIELLIEVELREIKPYLDKAASVISERIKIAGFRPGKAPLAVVEKRVGKTQVWEEAAKQGLPRFLEKALEQHKIEVLGRPQISVIKLAPDNPLIFKAMVAVIPPVDLGDYKKIKVKKPLVKKLKPREVDKVLKRLQKMRAKAVTVSRGAQKGDRVEIDFKTYLKNNLIAGGVSRNHPFILGEGQFVPGFEDKLVSMRAKEEKEFQIKFPRDYFKKNLAGRLVRFKVKVNLVQKLELPEINNQFAKTLGPKFGSLGELKRKLEINLKTEAEARVREKYELAVLNQVASRARVEIPAVLIKSEQDKMLKEIQESIEKQGGRFEDYLKSIQKTADELKGSFEQQARKRMKTSLVLREIARKEKVKVPAKQIELEINKALKLYPDLPEAKKRSRSPEYREYIRGMLRNRKVIKMLCD